MRTRQFASDNYSGICPEALEAMIQANRDHAIPYGEDAWTAEAATLLRDIFETRCEVFFVFNGTAANSLAISHCCQSYHSVLCTSVGHIETDECGAPEFFSNGAKILHLPSNLGKLDLQAVEEAVTKRSDIHYPKPRVVSLTQATECGTVYSVEELRAVQEVAMRHRLRIHMDGARFANAVAALEVSPKELTWKVGVDVLCFGLTKNGLAVGEAVIFFDRNLAAEFDYRCKQAGQLASKMRFLSAPFLALIKSGAWLKNARNANAQAARLEAELRALEQVEIVFPRQANTVFVRLSDAVAARLAEKGWRIYSFIGGAHRLMCCWDTTEADVAALLADLREALDNQ